MSRVGSNNVHFMLVQPGEYTTAGDYFDSCYMAGAELNLIGTYEVLTSREQVTMIEPADAIAPNLKPIWSVGVRLAFDWRFYYAKKKNQYTQH